MATKSGRYQLRSSQQLNHPNYNNDYETPGMEPYEVADNAQLSQSDIYRYDSQMENFLSESFGANFNNMNPIGETDFHYNHPKEENPEPTLGQLNYFASQERNNGYHPEGQQQLQQFIPLGGEYQGAELGVPPTQYVDEFYPGGFVCSQERNKDEHTFAVTVMPQSKATNRDYLPEKHLLYVRQMTATPFLFAFANAEKKSSKPMPPEMSIRMSLRFVHPVSDAKKRVCRCHVHRDNDEHGLHTRFPFIVNHKEAVYDDSTLRVTIPASTVVSLTFQCFSSCAGGIDRKAVYILFELLNPDGSVHQIVRMPVKACANPSRDAVKDEEKRQKELEKLSGIVKPEVSGGVEQKKGRKRKTGDGTEMEKEIKRMDSSSPMQPLHTPSPGGWSTTMSAPRPSSRRSSKLEFNSTSSDGMAVESAGGSRKASHEENDEGVFVIKVHGRKKYEAVMAHVQLLEKNERYASRHDEDNPFENLTQITGDVPISNWLNQFGLNETPYVNAFHSMGIVSLDQLESAYNPSLFHAQIGIPQRDAAKLNKVYLNWLNVSRRFD